MVVKSKRRWLFANLKEGESFEPLYGESKGIARKKRYIEERRVP